MGFALGPEFINGKKVRMIERRCGEGFLLEAV